MEAESDDGGQADRLPFSEPVDERTFSSIDFPGWPTASNKAGAGKSSFAGVWPARCTCSFAKVERQGRIPTAAFSATEFATACDPMTANKLRVR